MDLKKKIKDDVWNIIENKEVERLTREDWINIVFHLLLEGDNFMVENCVQLADDLKELYDDLIDSVEDRILNGNGELLQVLKNIDKYYDDKIKPILMLIKKFKVK